MAIKSTLRKGIKFFALIVVLVFHIVLFATVNYVFPHYEVTRVTGVEVKRVDKDGPITKANPADGPTRDVYYIYTQKDGSDKPMVYRNEDTRWGFPFYFKFGSANLQAQASNFQNEHKLVQIKYYGWRLVMFDEYRNATSMKEVSAGETESYPVLSWIFYVLFALSFILCVQFIRGWFDSEE
ncbi:uncharacterized protein DUF1523 [Cricetibacter osteomyelitidis]|uniref:Uncharacterized protein DUF1523 n=1 Tax=Cricetibacter osteomyelitidis TaxID=1521931 RepID=A0A4R2T651_9PAST|nr:DUF1523 family protein [Cricetibacter osteomyelitidis]TCP96906.1 uncharacterized protein DUF1523 [Cricetibacter osteomyelitidis]